MIGPHAKVERIPGWSGLSAVLTPCGKGWSYNVQDGHGQIYASGWTQGKKREAFADAVAKIEATRSNPGGPK